MNDRVILASGHTVLDFALTRRLRQGVELDFGVDNLLGREYWETQSFFESRLQGQAPTERINATPSYGAKVIVGITVRFGGK